MRMFSSAAMADFFMAVTWGNIMRKLLVGVVFMLLGAGSVAAQNCGAVQMEALYATVLIQGNGGTGSGTVIYSTRGDDKNVITLILTNNHVIASSVTVEKEWDPKKGKKVDKERRQQVTANWFEYNDCSTSVGTRGKSARIVAYDKAADLALLQLVDIERSIDVVANLHPFQSAPP